MRLFKIIIPVILATVFTLNSCKQENPIIASTTVPKDTTYAATNLTNTDATLNGEVLNEEGSSVTQRGFCWSKNPNPTLNDSFSVDNYGPGFFSHDVTNLDVLTIYYVRAYATNSYGTAYGNEINFTTGIAIGLPGYGGIVFYIDGTSQHGLTCTAFDQGEFSWSNNFTTLIGSTSDSIGSGQTNTTAIVNGDTSINIAAKICNNLVLNGYSDWFLPSQDELDLMRTNLSLNGIGNFSGIYWSSTENNTAFAWGQTFSDGFTYPWYKNQIHKVRAIRVF